MNIFGLLLALLLIRSASTFNFTCDHKRPDYILSSSTNDHHWCNVIENLTIEHENVKLNALNISDSNRIEGFVVENKQILYFPRKLEDNFKNLNSIIIKNCSLKAITSKNLKNFKLLQHLDLSYNEIEILEEKVFDFGVTLLSIILNNNRIKSIHILAFKPYGLGYLDLESNNCISEKAEGSKDLQELLKSLVTECPFDIPDNKDQKKDYKSIKEEITLKNVQIHNEQDLIKTTLNDSSSNIKDYVTYGLIILFFISLITIIIYVKRNSNSSISHDIELPKTDKIRLRPPSAPMDVRKSENIYEVEAVYEEIKYDANQPDQKCENVGIDDFYVETNESEKIEDHESYTAVYRSTEDLK